MESDRKERTKHLSNESDGQSKSNSEEECAFSNERKTTTSTNQTPFYSEYEICFLGQTSFVFSYGLFTWWRP